MLCHSQIIVRAIQCGVQHGPGRHMRITFWPHNLTAQLCILCEFSGSHSGAVPLMTQRFVGTCRRHLDLAPLNEDVSFH